MAKSGPEFLLKKAERLDGEFQSESPAGIMAGLFAHVDIDKLADELPPKADEAETLEILEACDGPGRRLLAIAWLRKRRLKTKQPLAAAEAFLIDGIGQPSALVRQRAAGELAHLGTDAARRALETRHRGCEDPEERDWLEGALAQFAYPVIPAHVRKRFADPDTRRDAIEALANVRSYDATDLLLEGLEDKDKHIASGAFDVLKAREDPRIAPALVELLTRGRAWTRILAARLLGERKEDLATETLLELVRNGRSRDLRKTAALALGKIGNEAAVPTLLGCLTDREQHIVVRAAAVIALGRTGDPRALEPLTRVVTDRADGSGRVDLMMGSSLYSAAIEAIGRLAVPGSADALIGFLTNKDEYERGEAATCLARLGHVDAIPAVEQALELPVRYSDGRDKLEKALNRLRKAAAKRKA